MASVPAPECPFEMELFIAAIHSEPAVWNYTSESYKNRVEKTKAWDKICMTLYPNFPEMSDKEKNDAVSLLQRKWKSLRDSYNRELNKLKKVKSMDDAFSKRKYIYFDQLSFLQPLAEQRITMGQQEEKESIIKEEMVDSISDHVVEPEIVEEIMVPPPLSQKKTKRSSMSREVAAEPGDVDRARNHRKNKKKKLSKRDKRDEDILFCLSLVNDLKRIPDVLRTDAKCELLQVLKRYKMAGNPMYPVMHHPGAYPPPSHLPSTPLHLPQTPYTDTSLLRLAKVEMGPGQGNKKKPRKGQVQQQQLKYPSSSSSSSSEDSDVPQMY